MKAIDNFRSMPADKQFRVFAAALGIVLIIDVLAVGLVSFYEPMFDISNYYGNINNVVIDHLMPYSGFTFEYPPLALLVFIIPRIFSWDLCSFHTAYAIFAALAYILFAFCLLKITDHFKIQRANVYLSLIVLAIVGNQFITARNDIFAVLSVTAAFMFFAKERYDLSAVMLAVGAMIKIYPIILFPVFMLLFLMKRNPKGMFRYVIVGALFCVIAELPFIIADPGTAFEYLTYHSDRGLQVEGIVSSVITFINLFVPIIDEIGIYYGSNTIVGEIPDMCARFLDVAVYAALIITFLAAVFICRKRVVRDEKDGLRLLAALSAIIVMVFTAFSKVYSAQYMLWFLSLLPLFLLSPGDDRYREMVKYTVLYVIFAIPSSALAFTVGGLYPVDNVIPIVLVLLKNVMHIVLLVFVIKAFVGWVFDKKSENIAEKSS